MPLPFDDRAAANATRRDLQRRRRAGCNHSLSAAATTMRAKETSPEIGRAFYWTSANLSRKVHRKHDAATYMALWKSLSGGSTDAGLAAAIDVGELRAAQHH